MPAAAGITPTPGSHSLEITQVFVVGGNSGAPYNVNYIELFNAGPVPVDLTDWTIQYQSATGNFGESNTYFIGNNSPFKSSGQPYPAGTVTYSATGQAALAKDPVTGHYTLAPGQYLLIQIAGQGTLGTNAALPVTPDLVFGNNIVANSSSNGLKPSPSGGKFGLMHGTTPIVCGSANGNPGTNPYYTAPYAADFVGYKSDTGTAPNCFEGANYVYIKPASGSKNVVAMLRKNPCVDTDNNGTTDNSNGADFTLTVVGSGVTSGWVLHNSQKAATNGDPNSAPSYTPTACAKVGNTVAPNVEEQASPAEVEANTANGTPVTLTVTVTDGGSNPISAVGFNMTADLSQVGGLVETSEAATPQSFGYLGLDPSFGNPQYVFPPANQPAPPAVTFTVNPPMTDVGKTYSIPIIVIDDAQRKMATSVQLKVVTSTPGKATASILPSSVVETIPTPVTVTATIMDPGAYPTGVNFTASADLSSAGGSVVPLIESGTDASGHRQFSAQVTLMVPQRGTYNIPVTVTDDQSRTLTVTPSTLTLTATQAGPITSLSATSLDFGNQNLGSTSSGQGVTLSNTGTADLVISGITASADFAQTNNCPVRLPMNQSCLITVAFAPTAGGTRTGQLGIADNADGSPHVVALSGNGVPVPFASLAPTSLDFGSVVLTTSSAGKTVTLTNTGSATLAINNIGVTGDFAQTTTCKSSLAVNSSCTITITFTPTATGARTGVLTITDNSNNSAGSQQTATLTGAGTDFAMPPSSGGTTSVSVKAGQPANYNLQLVPAGGFTGNLVLTCTGAPQAATCTVSPSSLNVTGSAATPVTVSVTTTAQTQLAQAVDLRPIVGGQTGWRGPSLPLTGAFLVLGLSGAAFLFCARARPQWRAVALCGALLGAIGLTACGGLKRTDWPSQPVVATPAGTYTLTVTAKSGTVSHTTALTLTVN